MEMDGVKSESTTHASHAATLSMITPCARQSSGAALRRGKVRSGYIAVKAIDARFEMRNRPGRRVSTCEPMGEHYEWLMADGSWLISAISHVRLRCPIGERLMKTWMLVAVLMTAAGSILQPQEASRTDWIDADTGHRVVRLTGEAGGSTLYFHDNAFSPEGKTMMFNTPDGIAIMDVAAIGKKDAAFEIV